MGWKPPWWEAALATQFLDGRWNFLLVDLADLP